MLLLFSTMFLFDLYGIPLSVKLHRRIQVRLNHCSVSLQNFKIFEYLVLYALQKLNSSGASYRDKSAIKKGKEPIRGLS